MRVVDSFINRSEEVVLNELQSIASDNALKVFSKPRLSDIVVKGRGFLTQREFDFYTRSHFDFFLTDHKYKPIMAIEYDGPVHVDAKQQERDGIKNEICAQAELGILRIHDRHVTKLYRGMTVLRWIVEVTELEKAFYDAQLLGQIPADEPFDALLMDTTTGSTRFPYWLSATATQSFHNFFKTIDPRSPKGWASVVGKGSLGTMHRLSYLYFEDNIIWVNTAIRKQGIDFPDFELLGEIDICELGIKFEKFKKGQVAATTKSEFQKVFQNFCEKYSANLSHSMGVSPINYSWDGHSNIVFS